MFINVSNHPSTKWSTDQMVDAFNMCGVNEIKDIPFPQVDASAPVEDILSLAIDLFDRIRCYENNVDLVVMVQGEASLSWHLVNMLKSVGIVCVVATSDRMVTELVLPDGSTKKDVIFKFVQFRQI